MNRSVGNAGTCQCLCWHWLRTILKSPCVWMQFLNRHMCRPVSFWIAKQKPTTHKRRIDRESPTKRMWKFMWKHIVCDILMKFSCRSLFKFIYVQIKLNASRNRFVIGCGSGNGRITLVKLRSFVASFFGFSSLSSRAQTGLRVESILRQQVNHRRFQCKINTHTCANAYARTEWVASIT